MKCFCKGCDSTSCTCRQFLKPTKGKIIAFAILVLLVAIPLWLLITDFFNCIVYCPAGQRVGVLSMGYECPPVNSICTIFYGIGFQLFLLIFLWPTVVIGLISNLLPTLEDTKIIPDIIVLVLGFILSLAWLWILSCLIVKVFRKLRKK